ncbi:MAG: sulfatase-like hydrolase/transferase [Bacteroidales bacterium]|nr:sulfatase-like hydrolase/transferase [Bacteroidales bacterium]
MKEKILHLVQHFAVITIAFLPVPFLIRIFELIKLTSQYDLPYSFWSVLLAGFGVDVLLFFTLAAGFLIPYLLISLINRKLGSFLTIGVLLLVSMVYAFLVSYFTITLVPLDQVIFAYSFDELVKITLSSTRFDLIGVVGYGVILATPLLIYGFIRNLHFRGEVLYSFLVVLVCSPFLAFSLMPERSSFQSQMDYYLRVNKFMYAATKCYNYLMKDELGDLAYYISPGGDEGADTNAIYAISRRYQHSNPEFLYPNPGYPFLRYDKSEDVLGPYLSLKEEKPNIVIIIVESLSPSFMGKNPYYRSFMPFLDSLRQHSLYWENVLATTERTFGVLPAIFGSLPYSQGAFLHARQVPNHYSLIRTLKENGYYVHFFYGGDIKFYNYEKFLRRERVDYFLTFFDDSYKDHVIFEEWFRWGYPDGDLFERSHQILDSFPVSPRLDIYLTISMHAPFRPPDENAYLEKVDGRMLILSLDDNKKKAVEKQKHVFSAILYTDEALREFFREYAGRDDFQNTIFVITGDHAMPELSAGFSSPISKYQVPLIIYSPMLTKSATFDAISSHLDIAPTILAMLRSRYLIPTQPYCHWLGSGIETEAKAQNPHPVIFTLNNLETVDYFKGDYFLSYDRLYKREKDLNFISDKDEMIKSGMTRDLKDYLVLSNYVVEKNALLPYTKFFEEAFRLIPVVIDDPVRFTGIRTSAPFISVVRGMPIGKDYKFIDFDISLSFTTPEEDTAKIPDLVFEVIDTITQYFYYATRLIPDISQTSTSGNVRRMKGTNRFELGFIPNISSKVMKLYLWNRFEIPLEMESLNVSVNGYLPFGHSPSHQDTINP